MLRFQLIGENSKHSKCTYTLRILTECSHIASTVTEYPYCTLVRSPSVHLHGVKATKIFATQNFSRPPSGATLTPHIFGGHCQAWRGTQKHKGKEAGARPIQLYRRKTFTAFLLNDSFFYGSESKSIKKERRLAVTLFLMSYHQTNA